jgi:hypothetical protein
VVVGIEGCRNGWVAVALDGGLATGRIFTELGAAAECHQSASLILIDIPIGLLVGGLAGRECDRAARQRLGWPRHASVFSAPLRAAVEAASFAAANAMARARRLRIPEGDVIRGLAPAMSIDCRGPREMGLDRQVELAIQVVERSPGSWTRPRSLRYGFSTMA